ncbi:hypothetical protein [uncultured Algibacter sp.]|uniref:hypothetical protein n=1 Tax=uncultured Algibacter sp. TaxID=298659 RepID=UPI0026199AC3|nr:hypothetical protein [uncultured Algibacter sp.]
MALLLIPITIFIDTTSNQYYIKLQGLAKANLEQHKQEIFRIRLKILIFNFYLYPLKAQAKNKLNKKKRYSPKPKRKFLIKKILRMTKTFRVTHFLINIDTDNYILNAKLYPLFGLLNYNGCNCHINFQGQNQLILLVKNRPINIIKSFINF